MTNIANLPSIENAQRVIDQRHLQDVINAVQNRIANNKSFGSVPGREGMKVVAQRLEEKFEYWLLGINDKVPAEFQEIKKKENY